VSVNQRSSNLYGAFYNSQVANECNFAILESNPSSLRTGLALTTLFKEATQSKRLVGKNSAFENLFKNARPAVLPPFVDVDQQPIIPAKRKSIVAAEKGKKRKKGYVAVEPVVGVKAPVKKKGGQKSMFDFMKKKSEVVVQLPVELEQWEQMPDEVDGCIDLTEDVVDKKLADIGKEAVLKCSDSKVIDGSGDVMGMVKPLPESAVEVEIPAECIDLTLVGNDYSHAVIDPIIVEEDPVVIDASVDELIGDSCKVVKGRIIDDSSSTTSEDIRPSNAQPSSTLVVIEECDILFSPDKAFWTAILAILSSSKSPVIFTANGMPT
jgi:hypothetical protein